MDILSIPLVYVEIQPLITPDDDPSLSWPILLTAAMVKHQLQRLSVQHLLCLWQAPLRDWDPRWDDSSRDDDDDDDDDSSFGRRCNAGYLLVTARPYYDLLPTTSSTTTTTTTHDESCIPLLHLKTENPNSTRPCPCVCRGWYTATTVGGGRHGRTDDVEGMVTEATMVRILPPCLLQGTTTRKKKKDHRPELWKWRMTGEWEVPDDEQLQQSVLQSHNSETIQQLTFQLQKATTQSILVGTTEDAVHVHRRQCVRQRAIQESIQKYCNRTTNIGGSTESPVEILKDQSRRPQQRIRRNKALLVHSPDKGAGKTALVQVVARKMLGCKTQVHIIRPGPLLAKFGSHADIALETIVHEISLAAAFRQSSVCVVLDDLDSMLPSTSKSSSVSLGDAASPALNGIASYLQTLMQSLYGRLEVPFPTKNPLYNLGRRGFVACLNLCLVAVVTCPDTAWQQPELPINDTLDLPILFSLDFHRYRLPTLTAETRLSAFRGALEQELANSSIVVTPELQECLPFLASSATWAHGPAFRRVAQHIRDLARLTGEATVVHFEIAIGRVAGRALAHPKVEFSPSTAAATADYFSSVGGNEQAKIALEDAISLDLKRMQQLARFGLSPPTGVLLYGPPGTGKTLLAKAVANLLRSSSNTRPFSEESAGGAFVSIKSSDVVRAEVGSGEKLVVEAFETAHMNAPSVVFIDEFQALFTDRNAGGSSRMTTALLECMEDVRKWAQLDQMSQQLTDQSSPLRTKHGHNRVVVLAATNTPWLIDKAFLRPGRFDRAVYVGLPDAHEREAIFQLYIGRMKSHLGAGADARALESVCQELASQTKGYSGADLAAVCKAAAVRCLQDKCVDGVTTQHFFSALANDVGPSSDPESVRKIEQWQL